MKKAKGATKKSRFTTVATGIRLDNQTGNFVATKSINGKRKSETFSSFHEAQNWRVMVEELNASPFPVSLPTPTNLPPKQFGGSSYPQQNGVDYGYTVDDVKKMYYEQHIDSQEYSSKAVTRERLDRFLKEIEDVAIVDLTSRFLDRHVKSKKARAVASKSNRFSFDEDLKKLKAMLNWYREYHDEYFNQPVMKRHKDLGRIKKRPPKKKKMTMEQVLDFFDGFTISMAAEDLFWQDIAKMQFAITGRIQEVLAVHVNDIDWKNNIINIRHAGVWDRKSKALVEIKCLKNEEEREVTITPMMKDIIDRQLKRISRKAKFLFQQDDGGIPTYRSAQYRYNKALRNAGLDNDFSATHIMRHASAKAVMDVTGSLEATQACTGHKDRQLAQHYSGKPTKLQASAANQVENAMKELKEKLKKK